MKKMKFLIPALLVLARAVFLLLYAPEDFAGERVKTPNSYTLRIEQMNGTDSHTLSLRAGDVLQVEFQTEKGLLTMEITAPDGTQLYAGNGSEATEFTLNITQSGDYTVAVEARRAEGVIDIRRRGVAE